MSRHTILVKGTEEDLNAEITMRDVSLVPGTVRTTPTETIAQVEVHDVSVLARWFTEDIDYPENVPFPAGTLLYYHIQEEVPA